MIKIICVGKIKEEYFKNAIAEYYKRIKKYTKIDIIEVPDEIGDNQAIIMKKEAVNIEKYIESNNTIKIYENKYFYITELRLTYNGEEKNTDLQAQTDNSMYGVSVYRYTLKSDYFKENFQEDTDTELYLSVKNENGRIDLGKMHIDNIPPSCNIPNDLKSWHWYYGNESRTITVTNISELLDETRCKVYDNGKAIDFTYSAAEGSLSFTLNGGWHNVGITLEDVAGNTYSVQEVDNIHIGYFWLWIIIIASVIFIGITITIVYFVRKKRYS